MYCLKANLQEALTEIANMKKEPWKAAGHKRCNKCKLYTFAPHLKMCVNVNCTLNLRVFTTVAVGAEEEADESWRFQDITEQESQQAAANQLEHEERMAKWRQAEEARLQAEVAAKERAEAETKKLAAEAAAKEQAEAEDNRLAAEAAAKDQADAETKRLQEEAAKKQEMENNDLTKRLQEEAQAKTEAEAQVSKDTENAVDMGPSMPDKRGLDEIDEDDTSDSEEAPKKEAPKPKAKSAKQKKAVSKRRKTSGFNINICIFAAAIFSVTE